MPSYCDDHMDTSSGAGHVGPHHPYGDCTGSQSGAASGSVHLVHCIAVLPCIWLGRSWWTSGEPIFCLSRLLPQGWYCHTAEPSYLHDVS